jgi:hypothetical protein
LVEKNKIKKIDLKEKDMDDVDLKEIITSLMENESVEIVDLSFNPSITGKNCFLDELLSYNDTIKEYLFSTYDLDSTWKDVTLKKRKLKK